MKSIVIASLLAIAPLMSQANAQDLPLSHKGSGTLYVQTTLGGTAQTGWLVDTGSDYSVIDKATLEVLVEAGQARYLKKLRGKMADGSERIIPLFVVDKLQLAGNCEVHNVKVAVLPHSTRRIMGLSALRQLAPFSVSFDPPMLTVSGCQPTAAALATADTTVEEIPMSKTKPPAQSAGGEFSKSTN